jgi:hypothetical protein
MHRSPVCAGLLASLVFVVGLDRDAPAAPSPAAEEAGPVRRKGSYWFFVENITIDRERQRRAKDPPRPRVRLWAALPIERRGQRVGNEFRTLRPSLSPSAPSYSERRSG